MFSLHMFSNLLKNVVDFSKYYSHETNSNRIVDICMYSSTIIYQMLTCVLIVLI